ncbi:TRAP transporter small permease subunit [Reinekea blandensis]|uniref:TRAP transporter small permease protein n=1 Tax=Reinekea blandensis MED297 TaxID=314283 RepID=A4BHG2_9GAMM|nr:TRAP transporter small permease subunit [Reinekea blandensis]EAR08510.1 TRAP-type mannitol/chloroaromatic compound transport system, small permease component [Reinekea sp. MED297] [Reinekea blandensis MED297]
MSTQDNDQQEHTPKNPLDRALKWLGDVASLLFVLTVLISFYEVMMRYVFNSPTIWVHETASFLGGMLFVLGGSYALATNRHVRVVLLYDSVSEHTRKILNLFHHVMGMVFAALMIYASYHMVQASWFSPLGGIHLESSGSAWDPDFPAYTKLFILIIFIVMFVQFLLHLIQEIIELRSDR